MPSCAPSGDARTVQWVGSLSGTAIDRFSAETQRAFVRYGRAMSTPADMLVELARWSAQLGREPCLVQGGGGNTSLKDDDAIWVKASGAWLADAEREAIFVRLPLAAARAAAHEADAEARMAALAPPDVPRPSIETTLHALLPQRVVAHLHSVDAIAWCVRRDAAGLLAARMQGLRWAFVPYRRPGRALTDAVRATLAQQATPPDVLLLANHGLVVAGSDVATTDALLRDTQQRLALVARAAPPPDRDRLAAPNDLGWTISDNPSLHALATDRLALEITRRGALYPDHVVFLGARALACEPGETLARTLAGAAARGEPTPAYVLVPGAGVLLAPDIGRGALAMLQCLAMVALRLHHAGDLVFLADGEVAALGAWEAEAYRRALERRAAAAAAAAGA